MLKRKMVVQKIDGRSRRKNKNRASFGKWFDVMLQLWSEWTQQWSPTTRKYGEQLQLPYNLCSHINKLCKSSYYHIRALRHIRSSLPDDICL